ncbi:MULTISPECIES: FAD-dependent monooxygenase [Streptomyces]|uniref:FAD-dependent monooxygenase n=1 Tax=Streptomyces TaxID=1883 RepID=UPI0009A4C2C6|nr:MULTISPECIES: FAD-dependent monooxygenase [Streptomyces]
MRRGAVDVLVVGAGPVGLTAAVELRRRGVSCRIVDRLPARLPYAKAVGIQPRTLELWDRAGMIGDVLDAAVPLRGQLVHVDGEEREPLRLALPPEVPYGFAALPQYETERILEARLARFGTGIERETELVSFTQDADGVSVLLTGRGGGEELRTRYLVGCDGAHSTVRKQLGLGFEGGAFPEEYMLADVEADWDLPYGYTLRAVHHGTDGKVDDLLVAIPLPGPGRYRMSMLVPPELSVSAAPAAGDGVAHGLEGSRAPALADIQAVLDRMAPRPVTVSAMRWSSVFRISHRIVDRYAAGRVFVAGDAAHIHPPTGAQGMNTGIQDAWNLAWKLALAVGGSAHPGLPASYDAERRPVGEEVVGRTVRHARQDLGAGDRQTTALLREAQLLVGYPDSPVVVRPSPGEADGTGPGPGERAPDCGGLAGEVPAYPLRLFDLLRDREHVLLVYTDGAWDAYVPGLAALTGGSPAGRLTAYAVLTEGGTAPAGATPMPVYRDARGEFALRYGVRAPTAFVVRPDGYLGARLCPPAAEGLAGYLAGVFA